MKKLLLPFLVMMLALTSCGLNNTMYNARKYFRQAQARPLNANGRPSNQAVQEYTKAIQKCGIILSEQKISRNTDDALFIMAQALFFKGNSSFQAEDQFETLIRDFPDSPFYADSHVLLAKVYREINRKDDGRKLLEEFILNPKHKQSHPKALFALAEFDILDKDYPRAQYWLEKIITEYPKSAEFRQAYFLFGKNYLVQQDYTASLREFETLARQRGIPSPLKLEAEYYIAHNLFNLGRYEESWKTTQRILNVEERPEKVAQARVLKSRLLLATGKADEGIAEFDAVTKAYPRTLSSSDGQYYLAEYYFFTARDLDKAMLAYNRVRSEFATSELADLSQRKAASITKLKQIVELDLESNLQAFLDYHNTAAENYLSNFSLPDSALVSYQRIIDSRPQATSLLDTLSLELAFKAAQADSVEQRISVLAQFTPIPALEPDSSVIPDSLEQIVPVTAAIDSLEQIVPDTVETDTLEQIVPDKAATDTLQVEQSDEEAARVAELASLNRSKATLESEIKALENRIQYLSDVILRLDREIVPLALFSQASVLNKSTDARDQLVAIHDRMLIEHPGNKYTIALGAMVNGQPIRLIDLQEQKEENELEAAIGMAESEPDSLVTVLQRLSESTFTPIRLRANFRLGWFYTFESPDTTLAKTYLNEALKLEQQGDYATLISRFFDGTTFKLNWTYTELDSLVIPDSLAVPADSLAVTDSLLQVLDSGQNPETEADAELTEEEAAATQEPDSAERKEEEIIPSEPEEPTPEEVPPSPDQPLDDDQTP